MPETPALVLEWASIGKNGMANIVAMLGDQIIHSDKLDVCRASARDRFARAVLAAAPGVDGQTVAQELLKTAAEVGREPAGPEAPGELDISCIERPELFHAPAVSGLAVPVARIVGNSPRADWWLYLRWADGRRERRQLEPCIDLAGGDKLWLHPQPGDPTPNTLPGWSAKARHAWLDGAAAPNPADLWKGIVERIRYFVDFPHELASGTVATLALWVVLSYSFPAWAGIPYLSVGGPLASGKSTLFRVLGRLLFRPLESSNMTAPCLFRTLHERGGVLLLDEAERLRDGSPEAGELRSILLSGYKKGSPASRLEKVGDGFRRVEFDVFGPKALAAIAALPESLASRCIRISMFRAPADSPKPRRRLDADPGKWRQLRDDLHAMALEYGPTWLELADRADVVPAALGGRDYELWQPLLSLAAWVEERGASGLLNIVQDFACHLCEQEHDAAVPELDELLLRILAEHVVGGTAGGLRAGHLLTQARELEPRSFDRWSAKGISNALKRYSVHTRRGTGNVGRVYSGVTVEALRRIEAAYGFSLGLPGGM